MSTKTSGERQSRIRTSNMNEIKSGILVVLNAILIKMSLCALSNQRFMTSGRLEFVPCIPYYSKSGVLPHTHKQI